MEVAEHRPPLSLYIYICTYLSLSISLSLSHTLSLSHSLSLYSSLSLSLYSSPLSLYLSLYLSISLPLSPFLSLSLALSACSCSLALSIISLSTLFCSHVRPCLVQLMVLERFVRRFHPVRLFTCKAPEAYLETPSFTSIAPLHDFLFDRLSGVPQAT